MPRDKNINKLAIVVCDLKCFYSSLGEKINNNKSEKPNENMASGRVWSICHDLTIPCSQCQERNSFFQASWRKLLPKITIWNWNDLENHPHNFATASTWI